MKSAVSEQIEIPSFYQNARLSTACNNHPIKNYLVPASIYLFKDNNINTRPVFEICVKLSIK